MADSERKRTDQPISQETSAGAGTERGSTGPRKSLWALMGQKPEPEGPPIVPPVATPTPPQKVEETQPTTETTPGRPRGLWSLMHQSEQAKPATLPLPSAQETLKSDLEISAQQATEGTVQGRAIAETHIAESVPFETENAFIAPIKGADRRLRQLQKPVDDLEVESPPGISSEPLPSASVTGSVPTAQTAPRKAAAALHSPEWTTPSPAVTPLRTGIPRSAWSSLVFGGVAIPASIMAIYPAPWAQIPPSVLGFAAVILGILAVTEIRHSRGRLSGQTYAWSGLALGVAGMFAGPLIYSPLDVYGQASDWHTQSHLMQVAIATENYYQTNHAYPSGGLFREVKGEAPEALHGWITQLLPFLPDGQSVADQIDWSRPYSAPENLPVMSQQIPTFLAAGGSRMLVDAKYGPSHFAGLGGTITLSDGAKGHVGIFDINSEITRDDVTDGMSQTLMIGEIAQNYPAWGEPRNWRQIGKGLNRDPQGFGNSRRSGALFLMTDGSVKFFSNQTDPKVLQALSTRDGHESY